MATLGQVKNVTDRIIKTANVDREQITTNKEDIGSLKEDLVNYSINSDVVDYWNILKRYPYDILEKTFINNGTPIANNNYYSILNIPVKGNTIYDIYDSQYPAYKARFVNFYNGSEFIRTVAEVANFTTPENCTNISVTFAYVDSLGNRGTTFIKERNREQKDRLQSNIIVNEDHYIIVNEDHYIKANHRIGTINFQFDDGTVKDAEIYNIFKNHNMVCGFALLSTNTRDSEYLGYQEDGFEILSHSIDGIAMESDTLSVADIRYKMIQSKRVLESKGYKIRGWVTPRSALNDKYIPTLKQIYDFGATVYLRDHLDYTDYQTINDSVYKLYRINIGEDISVLKKAVDDAISNNGFVTFYDHSADYTSQSRYDHLNEILTYINEKINDGLCYVLKPSDAIDFYYHIRHEDYLNIKQFVDIKRYVPQLVGEYVSSTPYENFVAKNAFDGNENTFFLTLENGHIGYETSIPFVATSMEIKPRLQQTPSSVIVEGKNVNGEWVTITTVSLVDNGQKQSFSFNNTTRYYGYRIVDNANTPLGITDMQFYK